MSISITVCGQTGGRNSSTCLEVFSRKLFGDKTTLDVEEGDTLLLYDYGDNNTPGMDDKYIYGPFTAVSDSEKDIVPEAWDGDFPYQVRVDWDQLYRLPESEASLDPWDTDEVSDEMEEVTLEELRQEGKKIRVAENGEIEEIDDETVEETEMENEDEEESEIQDETDESEGLTDIIKAKEFDDPSPPEEVLAEARNPGNDLLEPAFEGGPHPENYQEALAHLVAGKNVIFYGPPGSGKTRTAKRLGYALTASLNIETANAEWTYQDVVGGYRPEGGGFKPKKGFLTETAAKCQQTLEEHNHPTWLLIDELNRANLDEAFGEIFTLLDVDHRDDEPINHETYQVKVPFAFRILGTMNTEDQAQLFSLGYAFRRRFAFVEVPPLHVPGAEREAEPSISGVELSPEVRRAMAKCLDEVMDSLDDDSSDDSVLGVPALDNIVEPEAAYEGALDQLAAGGEDLAFDEAVYSFVQRLSEEGVTEIGQGIVIDVYKYLISYSVLFPEKAGWDIVDSAVLAYIVPQLESFMSELRRAETVGGNTDAASSFESVIEHAEELGFERTVERLNYAQTNHEIL